MPAFDEEKLNLTQQAVAAAAAGSATQGKHQEEGLLKKVLFLLSWYANVGRYRYVPHYTTYLLFVAFAVAFAFEADGWCCSTETFLLSTVTHSRQQALSFFFPDGNNGSRKERKKTMYIRNT